MSAFSTASTLGCLLHDIRLVLEHSGLVRVHVQVVGRREDGHDGREAGRLGLSVHSVSEIVVSCLEALRCDPGLTQHLVLREL